MELLQMRLHRELSGKRYLLVLDDVWNEKVDDWKRLRATLNCGDSGSVVMVTTMSGRVASIMGTVESYNLGCLSVDDSWSLFHKRAFSMGVKECQELIEIGRKMVQNCRGLPLAINALGGLMSYKYEVSEWLAILGESNMWEQRPAKDEVLPVLRLSYEHLPSFMKQCFAFCAVFPKDHMIKKEELIHFWMAHGFIPSDGPGSLEMKGGDIFNELCWKSFFQDVEQVSDYRYITFNEGYCSQTVCKMHDLMHDLAESIMRDECLSSFEVTTQQLPLNTNVRHISAKYIPVDINKVTDCFPSIRSILYHGTYSYVRNIGFLKSNTLRILQFQWMDPVERTLVTPGKMKHLRYLDFSYSYIESLPEMISTLYLLQTLKLCKCYKLKMLPEGLRHMSRLRHLDIEKCYHLTSMPLGLGQLSCLQTLTTYIIGADAGNSIAELKNLNLYGKLHIYNLREVRNVADAREANLIAKQNLDDLVLCWGSPYDYVNIKDDNREPNSEGVMHCDYFELLDSLKPCKRLKVLCVTLYGSDKFPVWMTEYQMLENLIELYILECRECTNIPQVEKLPFLRILELKYLDKLRYLYKSASMSSECDEEAQIVFPSLERLVLYKIPNLCSWCEDEAVEETLLVFPKLKRLDVVNCPKLTAMPIAPVLQKLSVGGNRALSCLAIKLTTLENLKLSIGSHDSEAEGPTESLSFQPWKSLEVLGLTGYDSIVPLGANGEVSTIETKCRYMELTSCNNFFSHIPSNSFLWFWNCFTFLELLSIEKCDCLIYWPEEEFRSLNCLTEIFVIDCKKFLGSRPESSVGRSTTEILLPNLEFFFISKCPNLIEIPKCAASIQYFYIRRCSTLQCLPEWLGSLIALNSLNIVAIESLESLPSSLGGLTRLKDLEISECPNVACLPEGMEGLKALKELRIEKCPKVKVLPEGLLGQLKNLDTLQIEGCPHLERHFRKFGKYRTLISEIRITKIGDERSSGILRDLLALVPSHKITCLSSQS